MQRLGEKMAKAEIGRARQRSGDNAGAALAPRLHFPNAPATST